MPQRVSAETLLALGSLGQGDSLGDLTFSQDQLPRNKTQEDVRACNIARTNHGNTAEGIIANAYTPRKWHLDYS